MTIKDGAIYLLECIGEIDDLFLEEAFQTDILSEISAKKRLVQYGTIAAAASVGIALTVWLIRSKSNTAA